MIHQDVLTSEDGSFIARANNEIKEDHSTFHFTSQVQEYEKNIILNALHRWGSQRAAADHLNLPISTLHSKIKKYGL